MPVIGRVARYAGYIRGKSYMGGRFQHQNNTEEEFNFFQSKKNFPENSAKNILYISPYKYAGGVFGGYKGDVSLI